MRVRNWSQRWLPLFLLAVVLPVGAPAIGNPLSGKYEAVLRNDSSRKTEATEWIGGVYSVDVRANANLADERSDDELSTKFAVKGTNQEFGFQMRVDAGHLANDSMARSTLKLSVQDTMTVLDENGGHLDWRRRPLRDAICFHLSFRGTIRFDPADSSSTDPSDQPLVQGETQLVFDPPVPGFARQGWAIDLRYTPAELVGEKQQSFDIAQKNPSTILTYDTHGAVSYRWAVHARTLATSGAIFIDAPDFFRIDAITFRDGTTPESHGFSLRFQSGLASPNLRVPEPSTAVLLLLSVLATYGILRYRAVAHAVSD